MIHVHSLPRSPKLKTFNGGGPTQGGEVREGLRDSGYRVRVVQAEQALRKADQTRMALEAQLLQSRKLEVLGTLAGGLAHDLNNVMGAILALAQGARRDALPPAHLAASLDSIVSACERGREVVGDLLRFVRKEATLLGPVAVNAVAEEVAQWLSPAILKGTRLVLDLQEGLPLVQGEAGALSQALMNLCVNAVDAMPEGGTLTIRTRVGAQGEPRLWVQDTGSGMPPEVAKLAMEAFFTTKSAGTGLGLSLVAATMRGHGGFVELQTRPGAGTAVLLVFPAPPAPETSAAVLRRPPLVSRRILLVDDDEHFRGALSPLLASLGYGIEEAPCGQEALRKLEAGLEVDLVLLDLNMPGLSGVETLIKLLALRPGQRVLLATGTEDRNLDRFLGKHPTVARIGKPFKLEELQHRMGELEGLNRVI